MLNTTEYRNECMYGYSYDGLRVVRSEDCLFLNIFVPSKDIAFHIHSIQYILNGIKFWFTVVNDTKKLSTLFYVHGGTFIQGSFNDLMNGPDFLMERDIILVTINHRLGVFGFLRLDTPEYSGNMGMKDIQMALKWTHNNIESFGGDKKKITLGGHSSGGLSAHLQLFNAESRKYFNQLMCLSGVANTWPPFPVKNHMCIMYEVAKNLNHPVNSSKELIDFLKHASYRDLMLQTEALSKNGASEFVWFILKEDKNDIRPFLMDEINVELYNQIDDLNVTALFTFNSAVSSDSNPEVS